MWGMDFTGPINPKASNKHRFILVAIDFISSLRNMYNATIIVLESMFQEKSSNSIRGEASGCLIVMRSFEFVFILYLCIK
jgi:hypothetical protein